MLLSNTLLTAFTMKMQCMRAIVVVDISKATVTSILDYQLLLKSAFCVSQLMIVEKNTHNKCKHHFKYQKPVNKCRLYTLHGKKCGHPNITPICD